MSTIAHQQTLKMAYISAVSNAMIVGFSFLFTKVALRYATPLDTLTYRFAAAFIVMSIPVALGWIKLRYRRKPLYQALLLIALNPIGFFILQAYGLASATSAEGGILFASIPIITTLLAAIFLKEETTILQKLSIFLSVSGVVFIFMVNGSRFEWSNIKGISLLFLSCLALAGYNVMARALLRTFTSAEICYLMMAGGFATFLLASLTDHTLNGTFVSFLEPLTSGTFVISIAYLGVMSSLITALTANYTLSKLEATKMSVFTNLSTIVSIIAGAIFLGEEATVYHVIGAIFILTGVMGTNTMGRRAAKRIE